MKEGTLSCRSDHTSLWVCVWRGVMSTVHKYEQEILKWIHHFRYLAMHLYTGFEIRCVLTMFQWLLGKRTLYSCLSLSVGGTNGN